MGNNTWGNALDGFPIARHTAVNTFTTARSVVDDPLKVTLGNELKRGSIVELKAVCALTTTGTPTFRAGFGYGLTSAGSALSTGVELAMSDLVATGSGAAAWEVELWYLGEVTSVGTSGVIYGSGHIMLSSSLTAAAMKPIPITAAARSATIDTTAAKSWHVCAEFGTSNASNQIQVDVFNAVIWNQGIPAR